MPGGGMVIFFVFVWDKPLNVRAARPSQPEPTQDVPYLAISLIFLSGNAGTNKLTFRKVPFLRFRAFFLTWTLRSNTRLKDRSDTLPPRPPHATPPLDDIDTGPTKTPPLA